MQNHHFATRRVSLASALIVAAATLLLREASAQTTCLRANNKVVQGKVVTSLSTTNRKGKCRKGEVAALTGPTGADGQLRVYGDGSSGALTVSSSQVLTDASAMYTDVVIDVGATLTVPSGTVIRCTGSFTNKGTITVLTGARGGRSYGTKGNSIMSSYALPHPGISARAAAGGESGDTSENRLGGLGGLGLTLYEASILRYPGPFGGGGGAGGLTTIGGKGGGSLVVLCNGAIRNKGTIQADGEDSLGGAAGGGGGVIILASKTSVTSSAGSFILARGGHGGSPYVKDAPGGGGGGGIVHFIAPAINADSATKSVLGGPGGTSSGIVSGNPRAGGAGGGASGGDGGAGGAMPSGTNNPGYGFDGSSGHVISTVADPTSLF